MSEINIWLSDALDRVSTAKAEIDRLKAIISALECTRDYHTCDNTEIDPEQYCQACRAKREAGT